MTPWSGRSTLANDERAAGRDRRSRGAVQLRGAHRRARRHLHAQAAAALVRRRPRLVDLLAAQQRRGTVPRHDAGGADEVRVSGYSGGIGGRWRFTPYVHAKAAAAAASAARRQLAAAGHQPDARAEGAAGLDARPIRSASSGRAISPASAMCCTPKASSTPRSCPAWSCRPTCRRLFSLRTKNDDRRDRGRSIRRARGSSPSAEAADTRRSIACGSRKLGENMLTRSRYGNGSVEHARVLRHRAARDGDPEARGVSRQPRTSTRTRASGTSASTATGIRRTRSCAARKIATACRPG